MKFEDLRIELLENGFKETNYDEFHIDNEISNIIVNYIFQFDNIKMIIHIRKTGSVFTLEYPLKPFNSFIEYYHEFLLKIERQKMNVDAITFGNLKDIFQK